MTKTAFKGNPVSLAGEFIKTGAQAPAFTLVKNDLSNFSLDDARGKFVLLNIFPSLDTGVCATSVRKFNQMASQMPDTLVLAISKDLPFAQGRFCTTEGISNVTALSDRHYQSGRKSHLYGTGTRNNTRAQLRGCTGSTQGINKSPNKTVSQQKNWTDLLYKNLLPQPLSFLITWLKAGDSF